MVCCELVPVRAREIRSVPGPLRVRAAMAGRVHARRRSQRALIVERTWLWVAQTCCRPCDAACQNPLIGTVRQLRLARPPRDRRPPRAAGPQARPPRPRRRRIPRPPRLRAALGGAVLGPGSALEELRACRRRQQRVQRWAGSQRAPFAARCGGALAAISCSASSCHGPARVLLVTWAAKAFPIAVFELYYYLPEGAARPIRRAVAAGPVRLSCEDLERLSSESGVCPTRSLPQNSCRQRGSGCRALPAIVQEESWSAYGGD